MLVYVAEYLRSLLGIYFSVLDLERDRDVQDVVEKRNGLQGVK
jgi:hypothetical protein